jgi:tetratricopeptide (TPR) repeat protein
MRIVFVVMVFAVLLAFASVAYAETVILKTGDKIEGKVIEETEEYVKLETKWGELKINKSEIEKIERGDPVVEEFNKKRAELAEKHFELAMWCKEKGLKEEMKKELESVIALNPDHEGARAELGYIRKDGAWVKKEEVGKESKPPTSREELVALYQKAIELLQSGKYKEAIEAYEKILKVRPNDATALYNIACAYSLMGEKKKAVEFLGKAVDNGFNDVEHIKNDSDLDNIREEDGYKKIIEKLEKEQPPDEGEGN